MRAVAALAITASSSAEWPVVPMTWTMPAAAVSSANASVAAGMVNSISPSASCSSGATSLDHLDAVGAEAGKLAGVAADHRRAGGFDRARKRDALGRRDGMNERAPHAPAGAGNHQPHVGICRRHGYSSPVGGGYSGR